MPLREPPLTVDIQVSPVSIALDNRQLYCLNSVLAHIRHWIVQEEILATRPMQTISEGPPSYQQREEEVDLAEHGAHIRCWWRHAVRCAQIKLNLRPRIFCDDLKNSCIELLQNEYVDLLLQESYKDRLSQQTRAENADRLLNMQVTLPLVSILRLRIAAHEEMRNLRAAWQAEGSVEEVLEEDQAFAMASELRDLSASKLQEPPARMDSTMSRRGNELRKMLLTPWSYAANNTVGRSISGGADDTDLESGTVFSDEEESSSDDMDEDSRWTHVSQVKVTVQSVQVFVLMYTLWGEFAHALHVTKQLKAQAQKTKTALRYSGSNLDVGSHQLKNVSRAKKVPPRKLLLHAAIEDIVGEGSFPPQFFLRQHQECAVVEVFVGTVAVLNWDAPAPLRQAVAMEKVGKNTGSFDEKASKVAVFLCVKGQYDKVGRKSRRSSSSLHEGSSSTIRSDSGSTTSWTGDLKVGAIRVALYRPLADKLGNLMGSGKLRFGAMSPAEEEFVAITQELTRRRLHKRNHRNYTRFLQWIHRKVASRVLVECVGEGIQFESVSRYSQDRLLVASSALPAYESRMLWAGDVPLFTFGWNHAREQLAKAPAFDGSDSITPGIVTQKSTGSADETLHPAFRAAQAAAEAVREYPEAGTTRENRFSRRISARGRRISLGASEKVATVGLQSLDTDDLGEVMPEREDEFGLQPRIMSSRVQPELAGMITGFAGDCGCNMGHCALPQGLRHERSFSGGIQSWFSSAEGNGMPRSCALERPVVHFVKPVRGDHEPAPDAAGMARKRPPKIQLHEERPSLPQSTSSTNGSAESPRQDTSKSSMVHARMRAPSVDADDHIVAAAHSALGLWRTLPWEISIRFIPPSVLGMKVGNAARRSEDFFFLDLASRQEQISYQPTMGRQSLMEMLSTRQRENVQQKQEPRSVQFMHVGSVASPVTAFTTFQRAGSVRPQEVEPAAFEASSMAEVRRNMNAESFSPKDSLTSLTQRVMSPPPPRQGKKLQTLDAVSFSRLLMSNSMRSGHSGS